MLIDKHHLPIFGTPELGALNLTLGIISFAEGLIAIFVPVFFWNLGMPIWKILFFYLLHSTLFLVFAFSLLPLVRRLSDKMLMFLSIPFLALHFLGLAVMKTYPFLFFALPIASALHALFFNIGYNINFSNAADKAKLGKEVGVRYAFGSILALVAPFLGGILIEARGFQNTFFIGTVLLLVSVFPLFFFPKRTMSSHLSIGSITAFFKERELHPFTISGAGYASEIIVRGTIWPLFIFIAIGNYKEFGGVISLGLIVTAIVTYLVGFLADYGKRRKVITWSSLGNTAVWLVRLFITVPAMIVGIHIGGNVISSGLMVAWTSQYYKITKTVSDATSFIINREILYNATRIIFIPILMLIAYLVPTSVFFPLSFIAAALTSLLFMAANATHSHLVTGRATLEHVDNDQLA